MSPAGKRRAVNHLCDERSYAERHACRLVEQPRATQRYEARAENQELPATARSVNVLSDVVWNKGRPFNSKLELSRLDVYLSQTSMYRRFPKLSKQPDIIVKIHEDVSILGSETISLTAFDPEDNSVLWTEERPIVDLENDVSRLVAHFLRAKNSY